MYFHTMEPDPRRIAREWNREIEAETRRSALRRDEGWGRIVVWVALWGLWLLALLGFLGLIKRLQW
jgi:type VI protein secretion system component VasF